MDDLSRVAAALVGIGARLRHGPPPAGFDRFIAWIETNYPLVVRWCDDLPPGADGAYRAVAEPGLPDVAGIILLRPGLADARWVLAHELGHYLSGCEAGYFLWADGRYHSNLAAEKAANQCAAALLLDVYELRDQGRRDWRVSDIARYHAVPPAAVLLRFDLGVLLGEYRPDAMERRQEALALGG